MTRKLKVASDRQVVDDGKHYYGTTILKRIGGFSPDTLPSQASALRALVA